MMEWVDFMFKAAGYQYRINGHVIPKDELYDRIQCSPQYKSNSSYMTNVLDGNTTDYERVNSEHWREGKCYFNYEVSPISGKVVKQPTLLPC